MHSKTRQQDSKDSQPWLRWTMLTLALCTACASGARTEPVRSPTRDYQDPPRSADDGEPLGAHRQDPRDTLAGSATSGHLAPGWEVEQGRLHYRRERAASRRTRARAAACDNRPAPDEGFTTPANRRDRLQERCPDGVR
jgi:hypothetical protein